MERETGGESCLCRVNDDVSSYILARTHGVARWDVVVVAD